MDVKHTCNIAIATGEQKCAIGDECECVVYCDVYKKLYNEIIDGGRYCYMTISPKVIEHETDEDKLDFWLSEFVKLNQCSDRFIIVVEYTKKMILHFHMMVKIKDKIKWNRGFVQRWYHMSNIEPIYAKQPKYGIHYLFKEVDTNTELLGRPVIYTNDSIKSVLTKRLDLIKKFIQYADSDTEDTEDKEEDYN